MKYEDRLELALTINELLRVSAHLAMEAEDGALASVLFTVQGALLYNKTDDLAQLIGPWQARMLEEMGVVLTIPPKGGS